MVSLNLIFPSTQNEVYLIEDFNQVLWFKAMDVCNILGFANPSDAIANNCPDASKEIDYQEGRGRAALFLSEYGLYTLIMVSRKEIAVKFRRWLAYEVLPSIRKTGTYGTTPEQQTATKQTFDRLGFLNKLQSTQETLVDELQSAIASTSSHERLNALAASLEAVRKAKTDFRDTEMETQKFPKFYPQTFSDRLIPEEKLLEIFGDREMVLPGDRAEIFAQLNLASTRGNIDILGKSMRRLGWTAKQERYHGEKLRIWRKPV
jgi:prophage antirepressor-like protein